MHRHVDINYILSFLLASPSSEFPSSPQALPTPFFCFPILFGTYLICSARPEPSMVLAPHRCSFSEMSFYKRHLAISDGKRCATLRSHAVDTGPLNLLLHSLEIFTFTPPRTCGFWKLPFCSSSLIFSPLGFLQLLNPHKLHRLSSYPDSQANGDPS